jgi:hypothetical protein
LFLKEIFYFSHSPVGGEEFGCVNVRAALFLPSLRVLLFYFSPSNAEDIALDDVGVEGDALGPCVTHLRRREPFERRYRLCRK